MASKHNQRGFSKDLNVGAEHGVDRRVEVSVRLPADLASAVEGWRKANGFLATDDAIEALVRQGLLSEIAKSYETVKVIQENLD